MGTYWTNPVRHPEDTGITTIRRTVTLAQLSSPETSLGVPIGALESGTVPLHATVYVEAAFNAGTTNTVVLGTTDDDDGFATSAGIAPTATGAKLSLTGALTGIPLAADKVVYVKGTFAGTAATTGKVMVMLSFAPKRETEGIPWPGN